MSKEESVWAIITAAGSSRRMRGVDKIFADLGGKPVISRVIETFLGSRLIDRIVLVLSPENILREQGFLASQEWADMVDYCAGGERRQDSVAAGLRRIKSCDWVIIHDGARPLVTTDLIRRGLEAAKETGVAIAGMPVTDTIKMATDDGIVVETPPRRSLWAVQTPQVLRFDIITEAYDRIKEEVTDDAAMAEQLGYRVKLYPGAYDNIKITTPDDLAIAEVLLKRHGR